MSKHRHPVVAAVPVELAMPFVLTYCRRERIPIANAEQAPNVWWWGVFYEGRLRAVMGLQCFIEGELHVWGVLGDGSGEIAERHAIRRLLEVLDGLANFALTGTILLKNKTSIRHARKHGWRFERLAPPMGPWAALQYRREALA